MLERIKKYYSCGPVAGIALLFWVFMGIFLLAILNFIDPAEEIEPAVDFPYKEFHENTDKYGDYKLNVMKNLKKKKWKYGICWLYINFFSLWDIYFFLQI